MINGEGDLPLHVTIKQSLISPTYSLLTLSPSLLHRENASGVTPLELAFSLSLFPFISELPKLYPPINSTQAIPRYHTIMDCHASEFAPINIKKRKENLIDENEKRQEILKLCKEADGKLGGDRKRRLVTLFEANEVARRLGKGRNGRRGTQVIVNGGLVDEGGKVDVVSEWLTVGHAEAAWRWRTDKNFEVRADE